MYAGELENLNEISFANGQNMKKKKIQRGTCWERNRVYGNVGVQKCGGGGCINDTVVFSRKQFFGDAKDRIKIRFLIKSRES